MKIKKVDNLLNLTYRGLDFRRPWHSTYVSAHAEIKKKLWITHPSMQHVLKLCQNHLYRPLVDFELIRLVLCKKGSDI